jgi:hypothetical protein
MTHKRVLFRFGAREKILRGATLLADASRGRWVPNRNLC